MKPISLFKDLARTGFHTSIATTFSVDAAFYDGSVFQRLRTYGCDNAILLADKNMLDFAIEETPESFARAGTSYAIVPVALDDCFHPKLHIRLGVDRGSLIVGSANTTAAGWGGNRELVASFEWRERQEHPDDAAVKSLIRKAFDFVLPWIERPALASLRRKLELIERDAPWLFETAANDAALALADGTLVDLFTENVANGVGMLRRLVDAVGSAPVLRLIVISPYWDGKLEALADLRQRLSPAETVIALNAKKPEFPIGSLANGHDVRFAKVFDGSGADRFIHAKAIIVEAEDYDHLLLGSANCSTNALGTFEAPASNAEASMYRRLPAGTGVAALGVELSQSIDPGEIMAAPKERRPQSGPALPSPGSIEAAGKNFRWRPSPELAGDTGAKLKLGDNVYPFVRERDGFRLLELPELPTYPIIARIELSDGRVSSPVLVNDEVRLAQAAPGLGNRKLRAALESIEQGSSDLLDLAALAAVIFGTPEKERPSRAGGSGAGSQTTSKEPPSEGQDYASAEAFRDAMESKAPSKGEDQRLNISGPEEVSLFRIIMRGLSDNGELDLLVAENENDGDEDGDVNNQRPELPPPPPPRRVFTGKQVEKRRLDVFRAMNAFEKHLAALRTSDLPPPRKVTAETCFILRLMVEASRRAMIRQDGDNQSEAYALLLAPNLLERDDTFVVRAGKILVQLWVGSKSSPALLSRLPIGRHFDELPYDCFAVVVMSRWAATRCVLSMANNHHKDLATKVSNTAVQVWRGTAAWPPIDSSAEIDLVGRLDRALGISDPETDALIDEYRRLTLSLIPAAQAAE